MKTNFSHCLRSCIAGLAAFALITSAFAAPPEVTTELDRNAVNLGDSAQLTITISGDANDSVSLPAVAGLEFVQTAQSSQYQSINGVATSSTVVTYDVTPQRAGTFTIPALSQGGQSLVLRVQGGTASGTAAPQNQGNVNLPPPRSVGLANSGTQVTPDGAAFARLRLPKHELYVGEIVPVDIQIGLRPGMVASLNGLPTLNGDAFTLNKLSAQPEQTQETVGGQPFTVLTWHSALAVVKPGEFSLSVETPLTVQVRVAPQRRARQDADDPFSDDFFDDSFVQSFFGGTTEQQITVTSDPDVLNVLPLPAAGRPAGFSGAVGNFDVTSDLSAAQSAAGDPLTLRLKVTGTGSFDRVNSKMLGELNGWKTYRPSARFVPADSAGYSGEKDFEQAVIPRQPGRQTVPALTFSFFNPTTHRYETKLTAPLTVAVTPAPGGDLAASARPATATSATPANDAPKDGLRPDQVETGGSIASLRPLYFQPWFLASQSGLVLLFASGLFFQRWRTQRANDPTGAQRRAASTAITGCLAEMDTAALAGDAPRFFASARTALQQKLATRWHVAPASITTADLDERLNGDAAGAHQIFSLADEAAYSGQRLSSADFLQWKKSLCSQLKHLEEI